MLFGSSNPSSTPGSEKETWSSWLDRAQRETWQMELLLTGFVILLLAQAKEPLYKWLEILSNNAGTNNAGEALSTAANILLPSAWLVLFSSLIFGVILRALWISAIGLRSVSGDIDLDQLELAPTFDKFLRRRVPAFDDYISRLENVCSIIFGLTFMTVFAIIGASVLFFVFMMIVQGTVFSIELFYGKDEEHLGIFLIVIFIVFTIFLFVLGVYIIDFFSGSKLKQSERFSKVYYPIYRVLGWLTLARIYRPLYYNFVDNRIGRYGLLAIIPYGIILLTIFQFNNSSMTPSLPASENFAFGHRNFYSDSHDGGSMSLPMIESKVVKDNLLDIFLPLGGKYYKILDKVCTDEAESYDKLVVISANDNVRFTRYSDFISCVTCAFKITIDTTQINLPNGILSQNPVNGESQLFTQIDVSHLTPGSHLLRLEAGWDVEKPLRYVVTIPFFKQ